MQTKGIQNQIKLTAIAGIILIAGSCKKYLDPTAVSSFPTDYVFSNVQNAQKAVFAAYQQLTGDNGYGIRISMYFPYDNDEMIGIHQIGDNDRGDIAHYNASSGNAQLNTPFNQLYKGIEWSNICIYNIPKMDMYAKGTAQQIGELQRLYGEALTLRAQYYLELIRNWGDVPAQFLPSSQLPNLFLKKTDRDTIYNQLLNDLLSAESLVPWRTEIATLGDAPDERITKGAVKGLRARIALYRGGYSLRRASSSYGQTMARPADYKTYYQIAWNECKDLMARRDEHTLNASYNTVFKGSLDAHSLDPVGEVMFQVAMAGGTGSYDSKLGYYDGTKVNGLGNAAIGVLPTYFYLFDSTDTRRDVVCAAYEVNSDLSTLKIHPPTTLEEAKFRRDWITNPSVLSSAAQYFGINWPILRFSDVLLMFAEADNEINGAPSADAIAAFEEVRTRAYGGNHALIGTTPTDHDGFFNAIVKERSLEFGGEGVRKYDLIRWNLLASRLADAKTNLTNMGNRTGTFAGNYTNNTLDFSKLPDSVFYKTTSTSATGLQFGTSLYAPRTVSSLSGYTRALWISKAIYGILQQTGSSNGYAYGFKPNHSELLPIPQAALDANYNLTQDYGY
ncbi:MAG: RagB/SusD family nutrient uptake outer membrane protein [Bacteroidota bacterium]|nr:RagB/SusD family nutrient uptake outer membrane protein [Bacteroidota bacterium]MDP4214602.1 RagB/SusD family nutrient uptake outer membrane protein [Bacteroidota bacterium]MDP4253939.1 RagB/SusD family nutrient uptake outer membrane protein [Bacteroidota bacterium]MDP4257906.1 RagB/SusD family nutrient uptake outer membrane protein [Bacteroidota bacterium]